MQTAFTRKFWGLATDQSPVTHPVAGNSATDAASALQNFDGISYAKGSATLKQLSSMVGDEVFFAGVRDHFLGHRFGNATMADLVGAWERAGAGDLSDWVKAWLGTAGLDTIVLDRAAGELVRTTPPAYPAERVHVFDLAVQDGRGWRRTPVRLIDERTPADVGGVAVVPDPGEATWARFDLDPLTLQALPDLMGTVENPLMRASLWNTVRGGVHNATISLEQALVLIERGLPTEEDETGVQQVVQFALRRLVDWAHDPAQAAARVHEAAVQSLSGAPERGGVQLGLFQAAVATAASSGQLRRWLASRSLPHGLELDRDLRWRMLIRLATLGATDARELQTRLDEAPDAESKVDHAQARASLPEPEAKSWAWRRFVGEDSVSNYELEATGAGFWRRGQERVTAGYVEHYFGEVPDLAEVHQGWLLPDVAEAFFPAYAFGEAIEPARQTIALPGLHPSLRRRLRECLDRLERAVAVRALGS